MRHMFLGRAYRHDPVHGPGMARPPAPEVTPDLRIAPSHTTVPILATLIPYLVLPDDMAPLCWL